MTPIRTCCSFWPIPYGWGHPVRAVAQVAMLLLLTFRLQRAAVRFYDCRAACGKMIEHCRNFASEACVYCYEDPALRDEILKWVATAPVAIKNFLRKDPGDPRELLGILTDAECTDLFKVTPPY